MGGVRGADEHDPARALHPSRGESAKCVLGQVDVAAALVGLRAGARHHPHGLQHVQVVRDEVRGKTQSHADLGRGEIAQREEVDDTQT